MNAVLGLVSSFEYFHTLTLRPKIAPQSLLSDLNPAHVTLHHFSCEFFIFFLFIFLS
jgi:hypothetical protein